MPNWTQNNVTITGTYEDIRTFIKTITNTDKDGENFFDFTLCKPMPKEFDNLHQGSRTIDDVRYDAWYEDEDGVRPMLDMVKDKLKQEHGTYQPIDWQYNNWGTKWGDCRTELLEDIKDNGNGKREVSFHFESAWGEPFMLLNDIAIKFNLEIENAWDIELGNGEGVSNYPWTPEDTELIYNEHVAGLEAMRESVRFNRE